MKAWSKVPYLRQFLWQVSDEEATRNYNEPFIVIDPLKCYFFSKNAWLQITLMERFSLPTH